VEFEKDGESIKLSVEDKGSANPLTGIRKMLSDAIALIFHKTDVTIPVD